MESKTWFITGASRGFGHHWMLGALRRGDRVAAAARDVSGLEKLRHDFGDALLPLRLDVTDRAAVTGAVAAAHGHFGTLDVIVNNAGYGLSGFVEEVSEKQVRDQMETNFFGVLWVAQAVLPYLRQQRRGHIVQVSSTAGLISLADIGLYSASKFAVEALSEALAREVKSLGIHVTIVEPGSYDTGFASAVERAATFTEYAEARAEAERAFAELVGPPSDPATTVATLLSAVDAENPPLRLLMGPGTLAQATAVYTDRIEEWTRAIQHNKPYPAGAP